MTHALKEAVERIVGQGGGSCTEVVFEGAEDYISRTTSQGPFSLCHGGQRTEQLSPAGRTSHAVLTALF